MNSKQEAALGRYRQEKAKAVRAGQAITGSSEDETGRALFWTAFVQAVKSAVPALVRYGMEKQETRPIAHKVKNWENGDMLFGYLLHARNAEVHAEENGYEIPNPILSATLTIGRGAAVVEGAGTISFGNCEIDGHLVSGSFSIERGAPRISTTSSIPTFFAPMRIQMSDVKDINGNVHKFPYELIPNGSLPEVFVVEYAIQKLTEWETELFGVDPLQAEPA